MSHRSRLITLGLLTFIVGVVLFFPARVAYRWFAPPEFKVSGISGSVWSGAAYEASADGIYLRNLSWQFRPLDLATGRLGYAVKTNFASGFLEGNFAVGVTGSVLARDLSGSLPLDSLQNFPGVAGSRGNLTAKFSELRIEDGLPVAAAGVLEISSLVIPLVQRDSLGGFKVEFFTQDAAVMASVEDTDAVVDLAGTLQILADRSFSFQGLLSAKSETPAALRQQMQFLGSANARGQYELRREGEL